MLALHSLTGGVRPPAAPQPAMNVVDIAANGAGAVVAGYLAGAAAGPAISASAATATGLRNGARPPMLRTSVAVAAISIALLGFLASAAVTLGSTTLSLAPSFARLPLLALMLAIVAALAPMTALITGTFFSPAIPFQDEDDASEYLDMQDSYRSDQWQPPRLWRGRRDEDGERDDVRSSQPGSGDGGTREQPMEGGA